MDRQLTPQQSEEYTKQLGRLGKLLLNRIADEMKRAKFIDAFPSLDDAEQLGEMESTFINLGNQLDTTRTPGGLENIIRHLRQLEFQIQRDRYDAEIENGLYYDIGLADYLVTVNDRYPEETVPHTNPSGYRELPDVSSVGGKSKKRTKKRGGKRAKKTRRRR